MPNSETNRLAAPNLVSRIRNAECRQLNWNIQLRVDNGAIVIEKEINIWLKEKADRSWQRVFSQRFPLYWTIGYHDQSGEVVFLNKTRDRRLHVDYDAIHFDGGFLKVEDKGLYHYMAPYGFEYDREKEDVWSYLKKSCPDTRETSLLLKLIELIQKIDLNALEGTRFRHNIDRLQRILNVDDWQEIDTTSDALLQLVPVNKNIHLEVETAFDASILPTRAAAKDDEAMTPYPLFFYPQDNDAQEKDAQNGQIYLGTLLSSAPNPVSRIAWEISNHPYAFSEPYAVDGMHRLTISQDADWLRLLPESEAADAFGWVVFEYFVDSIGLRLMPDSDQDHIQSWAQAARQGFGVDRTVDHKFQTGPRPFYIGYDPRQQAVFHGHIRRIFFDPGADCPTCP